jgi:hypothetical protein
MPCSSCGGGGSSASSQYDLGRRNFQPLQKQAAPKVVYVTPERAAALRAYYAQLYQSRTRNRKTLLFN